MIVDAHIHYFDNPGFIDNLLADMDQAGVEKSVLLPTLPECTWEYVGLTFMDVENAAVLRAVRQHPDRLVGAVRLLPYTDNAITELRKYADTGYFRLAKLAPTEGYTMDDERNFPFYEECVRYNFPVLIHMGQTGSTFIGEKKKQRYQLNSALANPMTLDYPAKCFPELKFIMAHNGYPYLIEAWAVAHNNKNVYLDISGSGPWVDSTPVVYNALGGDAFIPMDKDKIIWGSDNCLPPAKSIARADAYLRLMGLNKQQRDLTFGGNAQKLYNLQEKKL